MNASTDTPKHIPALEIASQSVWGSQQVPSSEQHLAQGPAVLPASGHSDQQCQNSFPWKSQPESSSLEKLSLPANAIRGVVGEEKHLQLKHCLEHHPRTGQLPGCCRDTRSSQLCCSPAKLLGNVAAARSAPALPPSSTSRHRRASVGAAASNTCPRSLRPRPHPGAGGA